MQVQASLSSAPKAEPENSKGKFQNFSGYIKTILMLKRNFAYDLDTRPRCRGNENCVSSFEPFLYIVRGAARALTSRLRFSSVRQARDRRALCVEQVLIYAWYQSRLCSLSGSKRLSLSWNKKDCVGGGWGGTHKGEPIGATACPSPLSPRRPLKSSSMDSPSFAPRAALSRWSSSWARGGGTLHAESTGLGLIGRATALYSGVYHGHDVHLVLGLARVFPRLLRI